MYMKLRFACRHPSFQGIETAVFGLDDFAGTSPPALSRGHRPTCPTARRHCEKRAMAVRMPRSAVYSWQNISDTKFLPSVAALGKGG